MEQQAQKPPVVSNNPPAATEKKTSVWVWILGGCLGFILLMGLIFGGLAYWGVKKAKHLIKENKPQYEQLQKDSVRFRQEMERLQRENPNMAIPPSGLTEDESTQSDSE
jgi:uncharacterized Tic20 family protein